MRKFFIRFLWALLVIFVLAAALAFTAIAKGWVGYMPPLEDLQNPIDRFATQVYSSDGKIMGTWNYNKENRICVDYSQLSPSLVQALIATEDVRFYEHSGIDFYALGRAIVKRGILGQVNAGGGSTITQQLAKQLYSETARSVTERMLQKPIEWVIAVQLERNYTKNEIIALYLNLTIAESATLIGLCKNPSLYNPVRHPERCRERRNVVLMQMLKAGYLTEAQYEQVSAEPLKLDFHVADHKDGIATYFREFLRQYMMEEKPDRSDYPSWNMVKFYQDSINWETDPLCGWCNKNFKKDGKPYNVYSDGLKVYTTIVKDEGEIIIITKNFDLAVISVFGHFYSHGSSFIIYVQVYGFCYHHAILDFQPGIKGNKATFGFGIFAPTQEREVGYDSRTERYEIDFQIILQGQKVRNRCSGKEIGR